MLRISEQFLDTVVRKIRFEEELDGALDMLFTESSLISDFFKKYDYFLSDNDDSELTASSYFLYEAVGATAEARDKAFAFIEEQLEKAKPQILDLLAEAVKATITKELTAEPVDEKQPLNRIREILAHIVDRALAIADSSEEINKIYDELVTKVEMSGVEEDLFLLQEACHELVRDLDTLAEGFEDMFGSPFAEEEANIADVMYELEDFVTDKALDVIKAVQYLEDTQSYLLGVIASETSNGEEDVVEKLFDPYYELETLVEVKEKLSSMLEKVFVF